MKTQEGANAFEHTLNHALEFFSKAGSLFLNRQSFYPNSEESALALFQKTWIVDKPLSMRLLLWLRDCRGGAGNRSAARECYRWLAKNDSDWLLANLAWLPIVGRWDDMRSLFRTPLEGAAASKWSKAILGNNVLAAKWADRKDRPLRMELGLKIAGFRRLLAAIRKSHVVEHKMCSGEWASIDYETVPSVAMARYTKAFGKNDAERFQAFKESLTRGEKKVHADVLFPHDCVRTARWGDGEIANAQFDALPNFLETANGKNELIIVISDTSGSMGSIIAGSICAMDVSQGMALYCSGKMPEDSPFYKRFIGFCSESEFKEWRDMTFSEAVNSRSVFDHAIGSTRPDKALTLILKTAIHREIPQELMPTTLLIVSDMQFHEGARRSNNDTEIERCLKSFELNGYQRPKIVYWNTAGYAGSQATKNNNNVGLVSGFSPSILKAVFTGDDFSPMAIMMAALEKYEVALPNHVGDITLE